MNDLVAMGHGVMALKARDLEAIQPGVPAKGANACILAAGTGLGETALARTAEGYLPIASEGGHADFAPRTDLEIEIFQTLRARFGRVSYERVLSGPGLVNVAEVVHASPRDRAAWSEHRAASPPAALPGAISRYALERTCEACGRALECFVGVYGAEAGNLALRSMATAGVYLGGGIAPKILPALKGVAFQRAFRDKEPHVELLSRIPVWVITNPHTALLGAARIASLR
jgi:glucokinase